MKKVDFRPLLAKVEKPARYIGQELNMVKKNPSAVDVRFCMCFPDVYEVAMAHLGSRIIYGVANAREDTYCERAFAPWLDMEREMREHDVPLYSLETASPLDAFDIIGFTLQYEMSYTNILNMLDLARIPIWASERKKEDPFVICGGPCACNPEPIAPFVDVFILGDGEETIPEMLDCMAKWKKSGEPREVYLRMLSEIEGFYVPRYYTPQYDENGCMASMEKEDHAPERIKRRIVTNLDAAYYPTDVIVPFLASVHDRMMLEIFRGCTRGCRFCQAGFLYRPIRERSVDTLMKQARELIQNTGYEEISLTSLSSGDYPHLNELIGQLLEESEKHRVSVSLPSLRVDSFDKKYAEKLQTVRKTGLTFAPEAGTQRLRDVINKGVTEEDLLQAVGDAFHSGWNAVKLYFMIGLPTETDEDLDGIVDLAKKVGDAYYQVPKEKRQKGLRITIGTSTFVPKPFTPFQWEPQNSMEEIIRKQRYLREKFKGVRGVTFHYHTPKVSVLEAIFARGDRRLADVLYCAWQKGCKFDAWDESFDFDKWMEAFAECGLDPAFYGTRRRGFDEIFPYEHIDMRVQKAYLQREYEHAIAGDVTGDCRDGCKGCFYPEDRVQYC